MGLDVKTLTSNISATRANLPVIFLEESRGKNAIGPIPRSCLVVESPLSAMHESKECMSQKLFDAILKNLSAVPGNSNH